MRNASNGRLSGFEGSGVVYARGNAALRDIRCIDFDEKSAEVIPLFFSSPPLHPSTPCAIIFAVTRTTKKEDNGNGKDDDRRRDG